MDSPHKGPPMQHFDIFSFVSFTTLLNKHTCMTPIIYESDSKYLFPKSRMSLTRWLTHWGRVMQIWVTDLTISGSDNGLSPGRRQAIIRTNAGILLIRPLGTKFSEILFKILIFSFKKMRLKMSSAKKAAILSRPQCVNEPRFSSTWTPCLSAAEARKLH